MQYAASQICYSRRINLILDIPAIKQKPNGNPSMNNLLKVLCICISSLFCLFAAAQPSNPGSGKTLLIIGQIYQDEYENFITQVGLTPMGASFYGTAYTGTLEQGSGIGFVDYIESNQPGSVVLAAMSFKDNPAGGGYGNVNDGLNGFVNGLEDGDIDSYINLFRSRPNTRFLLRVGYEVNSTFIGMDANAYIAAYRRIVDRIRNANVSNVEYVYHPVRLFSDVTAFYPGRDYVDWFALSVFNNDICLPNVSFSSQCQGGVEPDIERAFNWARQEGLPLMIAESSAQAPVNNNESSFNDYLRRLDNLVDQFDVGVLVYINSDWRNFDFDQNFTDARVQKFPGTQNFWLGTFGSNSRYTYYGDDLPTPNPTPSVVPTTQPTVTPTSTPTSIPIETPTSAPTPTPAPGSEITREAESGEILGSASLFDDAAASGGQGVAFISTQNAGFRLENLPAVSSFSIVYASELSGDISIRVNGNDVGNISFSSTGAWIGSYSQVSANFSVPENGSIDVFFDSGDAAMNVDFVQLIVDGSATPEPSITPSATPVPTATPSIAPTPVPTSTPVPPASDYYFIVHKPTGNKIQSCSSVNGTPITSRPNLNAGNCVQWRRVSNGEFFYLENRTSGKFMKPDTADNSSPISVQPNNWRGNWTQWKFEDRGDGFGHIVNRATGKFIFLSGRDRANIEQQPASWRGDYTRWTFESVN